MSCSITMIDPKWKEYLWTDKKYNYRYLFGCNIGLLNDDPSLFVESGFIRNIVFVFLFSVCILKTKTPKNPVVLFCQMAAASLNVAVETNMSTPYVSSSYGFLLFNFSKAIIFLSLPLCQLFFFLFVWFVNWITFSGVSPSMTSYDTFSKLIFYSSFKKKLE